MFYFCRLAWPVAVLILVLVSGMSLAPGMNIFEGADPGRQVPGEAGLSPNVTQAPVEPWVATQLIEPGRLAELLSDARAHKPLIFHIGPTVLYRAGHVPGSKLIGPVAQASAMGNLLDQLKDVPRDAEIVFYCGCCPWEDCPNIRPAFRAAHKMGFTRVKILHLPQSFKQDWTDKKYPTQQ